MTDKQEAVQAPTIMDIDQIAGANGGYAIGVELVFANGDKQWVIIPVEAVPRLFAKFMSAAHHARDERMTHSGSDPLGDKWRDYETMRANTINTSAVETLKGERRVAVTIDGGADIRIPFSLTPDGAETLSDKLHQMAVLARDGRISKPPSTPHRH